MEIISVGKVVQKVGSVETKNVNFSNCIRATF